MGSHQTLESDADVVTNHPEGNQCWWAMIGAFVFGRVHTWAEEDIVTVFFPSQPLSENRFTLNDVRIRLCNETVYYTLV